MEVILSTAFGRSLDVQGGKGGKLYEAALQAFACFTPGPDNQMSALRVFQFLISEPAFPWHCLIYISFNSNFNVFDKLHNYSVEFTLLS